MDIEKDSIPDNQNYVVMTFLSEKRDEARFCNSSHWHQKGIQITYR